MLTEKFRPATLDDVVGQPHIVKSLKRYAAKGNCPHMLFAGPAGTGKTTCVIAFAKDLYGEEFWRNNVKEMNASDSRKIDDVRGPIKEFAGNSPIGDADFKILFLDEADNLTPDAQAAMRRIIEKYSDTTRFILTCNYPNKIIAPIHDRLATFRFKPVPSKDVNLIVRKVAKENDVDIEDGAIDRISSYSKGSVRKALTTLNQLCLATDKIEIADVIRVLGDGDLTWVRDMVSSCFNGDYNKAEEILFEQYYVNGITVQEILSEMYENIKGSQLTNNAKWTLYDMIGETDFYLTQGTNELLQVRCLLSNIAKLAGGQ